MHFYQLSLALELINCNITLRKNSGKISVWGKRKELLELDLPDFNIT